MAVWWWVVSGIDYRLLASLFRTSTVRRIVADGMSARFVRDLLTRAGYKVDSSLSLGEVFDRVYGLLGRNYRIEYLYKNALLLKHTRGRSYLPVIGEFKVAGEGGEGRADLVVVRETPVIYEIKTEYDSTARLSAQIRSYFRVTDRVWVVTHGSGKWLTRLERELSDDVGIEVLQGGKLRTVREGRSNVESLCGDDIFYSLRQREFCEVVQAKFGFVPAVPNTQLFAECRKLFLTLHPLEGFKAAGMVLRKRGCWNPSSFVEAVPRSLKYFAVVMRFTRRERAAFLERFRVSA